MKLRIQDNSVRFRITLRELESLRTEGHISRRCRIPGGPDFVYTVRTDQNRGNSEITAEPFGIRLELSPTDLATLCDPAQEGVHLHREWIDDEGHPHRFLAMIEKDRPASTCKKVEAWIYEGHGPAPPSTVPIPAK